MIQEVTTDALIKRINRKLAPQNEKLRTYRGERFFSDLGRYYVVDVNRNSIEAAHVDVEEMARQMGVMAKWERAV